LQNGLRRPDGAEIQGAATNSSEEMGRMRFARSVFLLAGVCGIIIMAPMYFLEERLGQDNPPAITHPEIYYGFVGVTLAWQLMFLVIAYDPIRFRLGMLPAIFERPAMYSLWQFCASWGEQPGL